jgi:hypothetical protein
MIGDGVDDHHPRVPVDDHPVVLANELRCAARADDGRDVHAARDDRRVRVAPAHVGDETGEHALLELQHVGGRQVVRDQHQRHVHAVVQQQILLRLAARRRRRRDRRRRALHVAQDALGDLFEVRLAAAQVVVLHLVELAAQHLQLRGQRPFGVVEAVGDPVLDAGDQLLVLQQHQVHVQQRREFVRRFLGAHLRDGVLQAVELVDHRVAALADALDLGGDLPGLDEVVRHVHAAGGHQHGPPDGDAARDREPVDRERHRLTPLRRTCR